MMGEHEINADSSVNEVTILECRACLHIMSPDAILFNIFETWTPPWDGMENTIAEDLEKLANVKVKQSDNHSKVICRTCYELLYSACSFAKVVKRSDQILQQRYPLEQELEKNWPKPIQIDKSFNSSVQENSMNVEIKQEALSDNEYDDTGSIYENGDEYAKLDIKVEPEEMIQQQPSEQFTINGSLPFNILGTDIMTHLTNGTSEEYLLTKIKEEPLSEGDIEPIHADLPLVCLLCAKDFNCVTGLKAHVIAQHSYKSVKRKINNCISPERNKNFTTSTDLMVHETCHNKSICYGCNESFDTFEQLTKHSQSCKAIASQEVKKLKTLDDVLRPQPPEQPIKLKCKHCDETFTDMYYMSIHQMIHHSIPSDMPELQEDSVMKIEVLENIFSDDSNTQTEECNNSK
ncbi:uncharacterized protein LOC123864388 isoform X2 [Maniola jurtina]|uniref:uncharacterized protein LOC123864388 isoform X2 n=1 Tax=Maniola jurtina TaxID=191418 RepID=UPI001E68A06B|nr:uncharacterized protein LOC123864388 isoform X2 [Maniola jurtina]